MPFDNDFWAKICLHFHSTAVLIFRRPLQFIMDPSPPSTSQFAKFVAMDSLAYEQRAIRGGGHHLSFSLVHCIMFGSVYPSVSTFAYVELSFNFEYLLSSVIWHWKLYCALWWNWEICDEHFRWRIAELQKNSSSRADEVKILLSVVSCTKNMAPDF